ncbi:MAG: hypothetical protein KY475_08620 [Planctomycetes bacterium]|nr:hypothetical protein [Planctomycetota bacterium]
MRVFAVDRADLAPFEMPARFRLDVAYFMTPGDHPGAPSLGPNEYWVRLEDARRWLDDMEVSVVSPLDAEHHAEFELTDEQEQWLQWMVEHEVEHIRVAP